MRHFKLFSLITITTVACLSTLAGASNVQRIFRDSKLPTQQLLERQLMPSPVATGTADVLSAHAGGTSAAVATATTFVAQPDVPRNLVITPGGTTGDVEACIVVVAGTDFYGAALSENFTFLADASTATTGAKAFKTVSSITWPANCESGGFAATWSVGFGKKLGLKRCMARAGDLAWAVFDGAFESTRGTAVATSATISGNTYSPNGTLNGAKDVYVYFVQDFSCAP